MYELPLFPLNTVLFPGIPLRLHVFEDRYKVMLQRVMQTNHTFGVNLIRTGTEALGPLPTPYMVGCTARVVQLEPLEDGRLNLTVVGDERYKILQVGDSQPYLTGFVESLPLETPLPPQVVNDSQTLRARLVQYLGLLAEHAAEVEEGEVEFKVDVAEMQLPDDPLMLIYLAASLLQVPSSEKQPMLETESAARLVEMVLRLYRRELAVLPTVLHIDEEQARLAAWSN